MDDATSLAADIAAGRQTATGAMTASLAAARERSDLGALARLEPDLGLHSAAAADRAPASARGPLHGLPFLAKDIGGYARGLAPSAGCAALRQSAVDPSDDDALFAAFRGAGLLPFGLTTVPPFGLALTAEPPDKPPARNPFDPTLSAGGSSGGAAAAVAAGIVALAHATDAAGSTRVPAACCGLVGLKASRGRIPGAPHFNNHLMGIASEFVLARRVRDAQRVFDAVKLGDGAPGASIQRVGLCKPAAASQATLDKLDETGQALHDIGLDVDLVDPPDLLGARAQQIAGSIFEASLASWVDSVGLLDGDITPFCAAVAARGRAMTAPSLFDVHTALVRLGHETRLLFDTVDALVMPVLADGPPPIGLFDPRHTDPHQRYERMNALAPNVALANVAGLPALALPMGMLPPPREHLPFGFQIMAPMACDEALLALAQRLEAIAPPLVFPYPIAGTA